MEGSCCGWSAVLPPFRLPAGTSCATRNAHSCLPSTNERLACAALQLRCALQLDFSGCGELVWCKGGRMRVLAVSSQSCA